MACDCFLSYSSEDRAHAARFHDRLTAAGFTVWFDQARLAPGCQWHREIEEHCEASRVVLAVLTPRWKQSEWTRYETYGAESVIPLLVEGEWDDVSTPPLARFQNHTWRDSEGDWERLFAALRVELAKEVPVKEQRFTRIRYRTT